MKYEPAQQNFGAGANKTMLGETAPPILYNCPKCKKALEAPAIEAGTKKPCPACGQRLQVPAASAAAAAAAPTPAINKTMLGETEPPIRYNCPTCKKPLESPAIEAGTKKPCPACGQRLQVPLSSPGAVPRPNLNKTILATDESKPQPAGIQAGYPSGSPPASAAAPGQAAADGLPFYKKPYGMAAIAAAGLVLLLLLACLATAPGASAEREKFKQAQQELANAQKELAELKAKYEKEKELATKGSASTDAIRAEFERQRDASNRDLQMALIRNENDQKAQALARQQNEEMLRKIEAARKEALDKQERDAAKHKMEMDILDAKLKAASERPAVIQYAPAPYYRWHPAYGWGYW
jgi:DNA-directed RNA polymerase subunit RPC12/RpoP